MEKECNFTLTKAELEELFSQKLHRMIPIAEEIEQQYLDSKE